LSTANELGLGPLLAGAPAVGGKEDGLLAAGDLIGEVPFLGDAVR
jgi:hypothetical protein